MNKNLLIVLGIMFFTGISTPLYANTNSVPSFTSDLTKMQAGNSVTSTMKATRQVTFEGQRQSLTDLYNSEGEGKNQNINYVDNSQNGVKNTTFTGDSYLYDRGVNESKTIYTDDLGRLHFFGKSNVLK